MTTQRIGYIRVSTVDQNTERQLEGVQLDKTFTDKASGKDTNRPELANAMGWARGGDTFIVHSMDRLARNVEDILRIVRELNNKNVTVEFVKERMVFSADKKDPISMLMLTIIGSVAEFERSLIRERQREGIAIAKAKGNVFTGRKRALSPERVALLKEQASVEGANRTKLAEEFGISRRTLYQYLERP